MLFAISDCLKNRFFRYGTLGALLLSSSYAFADDTGEHDSDDDARDQAIEEYINLKRQVTVKEISGALSLSGEVHAEFQDTEEYVSTQSQRGPGKCGPAQGYDVEFDLLLDYRAERTWAAIKIKFDNTAGNGSLSGTCNRICLDRAYFGARLISENTYVFDVEVGRNKLGRNFDSRIEFDSFFDGVLIRYDRGFEKAGDAYFHGGTFVIDEGYDQYGYVAEIGWLNMMGTGFFNKLSCIDWDTKHYKNVFLQDRFRFVIGQWLWGYKFYPEQIGKRLVMLYGAYLYNFAARNHTSFEDPETKKLTSITHNNKENYGAYLGFSIGQLRKKYDFSFDLNYQVVAAQAVPDFDSSGIGLGNCKKSGFYNTAFNGSGAATTIKDAAGNNNFKGWASQFEFLFTDNILGSMQWAQSVRLEPIGPCRSYRQFEVEFIYSY